MSNELDKQKDKPFSLWKANAKIPIGALIHKKIGISIESSSSVIYNPFADVQEISYKGFLFRLNRQKKIIDGENTRTYYFRCGNPSRNCPSNLKIVADPTKCTYDIIPTSSNGQLFHIKGCKAVNPNGKSITKALIRLKAFAIEIARNNQGKLSPQEMLAIVLLEMNLYNATHDEPMPFLKAEKILGFFNQVKMISKKEMIAEIIPHEIWSLGNQWILVDQKTCSKNNMNPSRMILLSSIKMCNIANSINRLLIDGTFLTAPPGFQQVINGIGYSNETRSFVPIFHILLQNNEANTYFEALQQVLMKLEMNSLKSINFDFEPSLILAVRSLFNDSDKYHLHGCLFHFSQAIEKRFNTLYGKNTMIEILSSIKLTPFLSDEDYSILISYLNSREEITDFMEYFRKQWGDDGRVKREFWRYSIKDYEDEIITNGGAENFNGQINYTIGSHPNLGLFLKALYDFDTNKFLKVHNDSITKRCYSNCKSHYTPKQAKAEVNNLIPQVFRFKPKPKRAIHKSIINDINQDDILKKPNSNINYTHPLIFQQPKKHRQIITKKCRGIRKRNAQNTRDHRAICEIARMDKNKRKMISTESSSSEDEEKSEDNEAKTTCNDKKTIEAVIPMNIRGRKSSIVYKDRDGSEEEDDD